MFVLTETQIVGKMPSCLNENVCRRGRDEVLRRPAVRPRTHDATVYISDKLASPSPPLAEVSIDRKTVYQGGDSSEH